MFYLLANFGSFGQFWAEFAAFTVAESMPKLGLKSSKPNNFSTMSSNVTCNGLLESYHPYL
jgi:succinate-acetate transporter protein